MAILYLRDENGSFVPVPSLVGPKGDDGESAYQSAQKGGYTGTEADFYADLAAAESAETLSGTIADVDRLKSDLDDLTMVFNGTFYSGKPDDGTVVLTSNDVNVGDVITYHIEATKAYGIGYIDILNTSGSRIEIIGKTSSNGDKTDFDGTYTIPDNFGSVKIVGTIEKLIFSKKSLVDTISKNAENIEQLNTDVTEIKKHFGEVYNGTPNPNDVIFTSDDIKAGTVISYKIKAKTGSAGFIDILDTNGSRITYIGKGSSSGGDLDYEGEYELPSNFGSIKIGGTIESLVIKKPMQEKSIGDLKDLKTSDKESVVTSINSLFDDVYNYNNILYKGELHFVNNSIVDICTSDTVSPFDTVYYDFTINSSYYACMISFVDSNGTILKDENGNLLSFGKKSSIIESEPIQRFTGTVKVPVGFDSIRFYGRDATIHCISAYSRFDRDLNNRINNNHDSNRLANIYYETQEHKGIAKEVLFNGSCRIPTTIITNDGTVLVAVSLQESGEDSGYSSIVIKRKTDDGWTEQNVMPYETATTTRYLNPSFVIDRTGSHGVAGRIYLFAGVMKSFTKLWYSCTTDEMDCVYKYSDDDGITWSAYNSVKSTWDTSKYVASIVAPDNGIQLEDGTIALPCMLYTQVGSLVFRNSILFKRPDSEWQMSTLTPELGYSVSECSLVELESNKITILTRKDVQYPKTHKGEDLFHYDFVRDSFFHEETTFDRNLSVKSAVTKVTMSGKTFYLKTFVDSNGSSRENITIWASLNCRKWIRCYRLIGNNTRGYGSVSVYNGVISAVYEAQGLSIEYQDLSSIADIFVNSVSLLQGNVTVNDMLQKMFNELKGIN